MKYQLDSTVLEVVIPGDILSTNVDSLRDHLRGLMETPDVKQAKWSTLRLDLLRAQMIDSMGLNLIVSLVRLLQNRGQKMEVRVTNPNVQRTFLFTRLDKQVGMLSA